MGKRNFNMLFEEEENKNDAPRSIERNISRKISHARLTGDVVELFLPKIVNTFLHFLGGGDATAASDSDDPASSSEGFGGHR